ncbi:MAG TPA: TonB-dependent receptor, partial [Arachidicoccus sp.]|nr:TonB-dependent receptor [Arachidicoccus sp.]
MNVNAEVFQNNKVSLNVQNTTLKEVLREIEAQTSYLFIYAKDIDATRKVSLNVKNEGVTSVLGKLLSPLGLSFKTEGTHITIIKGKSSEDREESSSLSSRTLRGRVIDAKTQNPIAGASVIIAGTITGTNADKDGIYQLKTTQKECILRISYVGYTDLEINVNAKDNFYEAALFEKVNDLNEMVVVAYGTQRKISNIGAQATMKTSDLKIPSSSLTATLAGRLAGVISVQRTGEPGKNSADIWIRGIATPNSATPLILVDGVERSFNDIDPEDVESLTILKDASATAVYGVRGANGVIIIRTKPGRIGKPTISTDYYESYTRFTKAVDLTDGIGYMNAANEALINDGLTPKYSQQVIENTKLSRDPYLYPNVDWIDEAFNDWGHNRRANVNVRGGNEKATYYASVSYYNEIGMMATDNSITGYNSKTKYDRYNFTTNVAINATPTTKVEIGAQGYLGEGNYPAIASHDVYISAMGISPVDYPKMFYVDGKAYVPGINPNGGFRNPYADATRRGYNNLTKNQVYSNLRVTQNLESITKGLNMTGMFAYDVYNEVSLNQSRRESTYYFTDINVPYDMNGFPILTKTYTGSDVLDYGQSAKGNKKTYLEASFNYDRTFGDHHVSGLLLYNQQQKLEYPQGTLEDAIPYRMRGVAGRATYSWNDRYFAEFNIGYTGAENFSPNKRYGTFPAYGVGWVVSNEKFWGSVSKVVSFLKFRYTDGRIGNSNVSDRRFMYLDQIKPNGSYGYIFGSNGTRYDGYEVVNNAVDLVWEESRKQDLGIEMKLFGEDLNIIIDLFKERRSNILLKRENSIPSFIGFNMASPYGNVGIVENKGIEGTIEYNKHITKNWSVSLRGNFTYNNDKWIKGDVPDQRYPWMNQVGQKILGATGYVAEGLFTQAQIDDMTRWNSLSDEDKLLTRRPFASQFGTVNAGDIRYKDLNNDGKIDAYDKTYINRGDVPAIVYGFGLTVMWKELSISTLFQGVAKAQRILTGNSIQPFNGGGGAGNLYSNIEDRWTVDNPNQDAFYPRLSYGAETPDNQNNFQPSTWWVRDMSFLRLKTLQISYNLPKSWAQKMSLKNAA